MTGTQARSLRSKGTRTADADRLVRWLEHARIDDLCGRIEDTELLVPVYRLREARIHVDIASLTQGTITGKTSYTAEPIVPSSP